MNNRITEISLDGLSYRVVERTGEVLAENGEDIGLSPLCWSILEVFVDQEPNTLISDDLLVEKAWPKNRTPGPNPISKAVGELNSHLKRKFVERLSKRGHRFKGTINRLHEENISSDEAPRECTDLGDTGISDWAIQESTRTEGLVELRLHQPRPGNRAGTYYIDATVRVDKAHYEKADRVIFLSLKNILLATDYSGCQPAQMTMLGERVATDAIKALPGAIEFTASGHHLEGNLTGEEYIAVLETTNAQEQEVTLELRAGRRSFNVTQSLFNGQSEQDVQSQEKDAILNALIYRMKSTDAQGRVVLASSKMRREVPK